MTNFFTKTKDAKKRIINLLHKKTPQKYVPLVKWIRNHPFLTRFEADLTPLSYGTFSSSRLFGGVAEGHFQTCSMKSQNKSMFPVQNESGNILLQWGLKSIWTLCPIQFLRENGGPWWILTSVPPPIFLLHATKTRKVCSRYQISQEKLFFDYGWCGFDPSVL